MWVSTAWPSSSPSAIFMFWMPQENELWGLHIRAPHHLGSHQFRGRSEGGRSVRLCVYSPSPSLLWSLSLSKAIATASSLSIHSYLLRSLITSSPLCPFKLRGGNCYPLLWSGARPLSFAGCLQMILFEATKSISDAAFLRWELHYSFWDFHTSC